MNNVELSLFNHRLQSICEEMGAVLQQSAVSPNIRDRLDYSCAIFDTHGLLCAQAAHIPVHLGSMAFAMAQIVKSINWVDGDMIILNDPYLGGTHLPDITLIAPLFMDNELQGFVCNRAHHADIGADTPGSMPLATDLSAEGIVIPPSLFMKKGQRNSEFSEAFLTKLRNPDTSNGDFSAQISANLNGLTHLQTLIQKTGQTMFIQALSELNDYAERLARSCLVKIPDGCYQFTDQMDGDGLDAEDINISLSLTIDSGNVKVDFSGTHTQVGGNINCPLSVTAAAVLYVFRCLMPANTPGCQGAFRPISITAPRGSLVNAKRPAAVAAGNVETSSRITDTVLGALAQAIPEQIPAASQGTMNNIAMGASNWDYYETLGGGMGAHSTGPGQSAVQTHMTNTLNTPIEVLELHYPLRITRYQCRKHSGGAGRYSGGNGLIRDYYFMQPAHVTLLTERRSHKPWGLNKGQPGKPGCNFLNQQPLPAKVNLKIDAGDCVRIKTPGAGGWGAAKNGSGKSDFT